MSQDKTTGPSRAEVIRYSGCAGRDIDLIMARITSAERMLATLRNCELRQPFDVWRFDPTHWMPRGDVEGKAK